METDQGAKKRGRKPAQRPRPEEGERLKRTIMIEAEVDLRLTILAAKRGVSRSDIVDEALRAATRGIVVSFRSGNPGEEATAA
ncbi:hypothetical protein [Paludisphaera sp.]|uniref:hypothetical protein n=1 Tax=Paludisphaera sp. TaxID=2017432 RepID=UPI00301CB3BB